MTPIETGSAVAVLAITASLGLVAHELAHAAVLRATGIPYALEWFPDADDGVFGAALRGRWATVTPRPGAGTPAWPLRLSAMMPLTLLLPFALVPAGLVADPFATGSVLRFAVVGWAACALPSPQDFGVLWHASHVLREDPSVVDTPRPEQ